MVRMMFPGKILPTASVVRPVSDSRCCKVQSRWNLATQRVPCWVNIRGPENGPVSLRSQVSVARKNQRALARKVLAESVVKRGRVEQWIDIEKFRTWPDVEVGAVRRQIGLRFIGPERVKSLAEDVVADGFPIPFGCLRVRRIDVRPSPIVREAVDRRSVGRMNQPSLLENFGIVPIFGHESRPDADHRLKAHLV